MTEHKIDLSQLAKIRDGSGHSVFGASGSHMFLACAGSLIPNLLAEDEAGFDAAWGTVAHSVTEDWLHLGRPPEHLLGRKIIVGDDVETWHAIEIDESMFQAAEQCVDRCEWLPGQHVIEYRVDYSHLTPISNQGGTLDFAALMTRRADLTDHKFGKSPDNIVYAEDNSQLMLYAIGVMRDPQFQHYGFQDFILRINQPRLDHFDEWHTTRKRLIEFEDYARERMAKAWVVGAERTPGPKQCRFCKVKASCAANAKMQEDLLNAVFGDESETTVDSFVDRLQDDDFVLRIINRSNLTIEQKARLLPFRKAAESWWAALQADLEKHAADGVQIPGYKVVEGRRFRKFVSETRARDCLLELGIPLNEIVTESIITPAQAEKVLTKNRRYRRKDLPTLLEGLIHKPKGSATLVPVADRRPAIVDLSSVAFTDESTPETDEDI
jgi:hypothetical protein